MTVISRGCRTRRTHLLCRSSSGSSSAGSSGMVFLSVVLVSSVLLLLLLLAAEARHQPQPHRTPTGRSRSDVVLLLDVDNTLYSEREFKIEEQIVRNIHRFCRSFDDDDEIGGKQELEASEADMLHRKYGSTIEGLRRTLWKHDEPEVLKKKLEMFYEQVYGDDVDVTSLILGGGAGGNSREDSNRNSTAAAIGGDGDAPTAAAAAETTNTGYTHNEGGGGDAARQKKEQEHVRAILSALGSSSKVGKEEEDPSAVVQLHLASNSPRRHVAKVIQALGLTRVPWKGVWTPDADGCGVRRRDDDGTDNKSHKDGERIQKAACSGAVPYPTKADPRAFFGSLLQPERCRRWRGNAGVTTASGSGTKLPPPPPPSRRILIDDSERALQSCSKVVQQGIQVSPDVPVAVALSLAVGWLDPRYDFSQVDYLRSKNRVDAQSINRGTYMQLVEELTELVLGSNAAAAGGESSETTAATSSSPPRTLRIVDVGAGLLSMLQLFIEGHDGLPSLVDAVRPIGDSSGGNTDSGLSDIDYYAYEPNLALEHECIEIMEEELGFRLEETNEWQDSSGGAYDPEYVFVKEVARSDGSAPDVRVRVRLRFWDYLKRHSTKKMSQPVPHLIVGCCFADLFDPRDLVRSLLSRFLSPQNRQQQSGEDNVTEALLYFPITFKGITQFVPAQPFDGRIPSDTVAFAHFSKALTERHEHNLDPDLLVEAVADYGGRCLARRGSSSDWVIDPQQHPYLWETMLYFFGGVACPQLATSGYDARQWIKRARRKRPTIIASNVDLLFRIPYLGRWDFDSTTTDCKATREGGSAPIRYKEIQFQAPRRVALLPKKLRDSQLEPNQVVIESMSSLISSGTELKVFNGNFEEASLDVNIKGMEEERMAYPLAYGYSLVGRVVKCGSGVQDASELMGKLVFAFSPHASHAVVDRGAIQIVPDGISALDAIFMPSVETALSLVHDANPRFGEAVVVFGQGLVGLLVTAILCLSSRCEEVASLTTVDFIPRRLAISASLGSTQALSPLEVLKAGPFDVAIEVSGSGRALQAAIDTTRNGGRVIVGSWYGSSGFNLTLGIDFHRSHKKLMTSQVSTIPGHLSETWTKERRFDLTWRLVKSLRPSRLLTRTCPFDDGNVQASYEALDRGDEIAVAFDYAASRCGTAFGSPYDDRREPDLGRQLKLFSGGATNQTVVSHEPERTATFTAVRSRRNHHHPNLLRSTLSDCGVLALVSMFCQALIRR